MSAPLNDREKEIITAMADGLTAKEISRKIGVDPRTIYEAVRYARGKTDTKSGAGLVAKAIREGWIQ